MYCKLFIDIEFSHYELCKFLARVLIGKQKFQYVHTELVTIYVNNNKEYHPQKRKDLTDGFLYYQYFLDIEPQEDTDLQLYIHSIGQFLESLWRSGAKAVAACDFEELLPRNGGYGY